MHLSQETVDLWKFVLNKSGEAESPVLGKSSKDTYTLFIESESNLLPGYEYTVGYSLMLNGLNCAANYWISGGINKAALARNSGMSRAWVTKVVIDNKI